MRRYFTRKIITYVVAFFLATTIDWAIPRVMPGNPVQLYLSKFSITTEAQYAALQKLISASFGVNVPAWKQYLAFLGRGAPLELRAQLLRHPNR